MNDKNAYIQIIVPPELHRRIRVQCALLGTTITQVGRELFENWLKQQTQPDEPSEQEDEH